MSQPGRGPVVIDTSVYSARLDARGHRLASDYRQVLEGRTAIISLTTVAEMRFGAHIAGWVRGGCIASIMSCIEPRLSGLATT